MKEIDVEGLFGALDAAKPGDKIKLADHIKEEKIMNLTAEKRKINAILVKDYDHEVPDTLRHVEFQKAFKSILRRMFPNCTIIPNKGSWCEANGFIKSADGKFVYYSTNDYRYNICGHWDQRILIRTAENEKDYTGGGNHYADLEELEEQVDWLFKIQRK